MTGNFISHEKRIWFWGAGNLLNQYQHLVNPSLNIVGVCDKDINKQGGQVVIQGLPYVIQSPSSIGEDDFVIISVIDRNAENAIRKELEERNIPCCHIIEAVDEYWTSMEETTTQESLPPVDKMVKFVDCYVPIDSCNLNCDYCYLGQHGEFMHRVPRFHSAKFIRKALSRERMGGTIFINFCGVGETLLCKELLPVVKELIQEGHYIQIVTNATVNKAVDEYINSGMDLSHVFFKCSLHYLQLKKKGLLRNFAENIKKLYMAGASFTIELVPEDELVPFINEIKEYSIREFGELPHLTVARDERYEDLRILTKYSIEDYRKIWSDFNSPMFEFKMDHLEPQRYNDCRAGAWAIHLNLEDGTILQCVRNRCIGNIYDLKKGIEFKKVGKGCMLPYCYNCHAYLTLGLIPEVLAPTYFEMRDRTTNRGEHWINDTMKHFFEQKLYENNQNENVKNEY